MAKLYRYYPYPSDRMAMLWNLLALDDACVVEYGPPGTLHFALGLLGSLLDTDFASRYSVSPMDENDVVMGDMSQLRAAILEIDANQKPQHIFLLASSISAMIGADLEGLRFALQDEIHAQLHILDSGGFKGGAKTGTEYFYEVLAEIVRDNQDLKVLATPVPKTYQVLGASADHFRLASDLNELQRLLKSGLDLQLKGSFSVGGSIKALQEPASINLVLRAEALPLAKALEEVYGTPYLAISPYGYAGCLEMLEQIASRLGIEVKAPFAKELETKQRQLRALGRGPRLRPRRHVLAIAAPEHVRCGIHKMGSAVNAEMIDLPGPAVDEAKRIKAASEVQDALVYGDAQTLDLVDDTNQKVLVAFPTQNYPQFATHLPIMGERGMDRFVEHWLYYKMRPRQEMASQV